MRASEFLAELVRRLESVDLEYALVGSTATMSYGEPRATWGAWCSPPEELIVKKLSCYRHGTSDKHLRDIASMLVISPGQIDLERIRKLAANQDLGGLLDRVLEAATEA